VWVYARIYELYKSYTEENAHLFKENVKVTSFCQTWAADGKVGAPQFSQESPHFQTLFYLPKDYTENSQYRKTVEEFKNGMLDMKYKKKFVDLDSMLLKMQGGNVPKRPELIEILSFVPDLALRKQLYAQAARAINEPELCSKTKDKFKNIYA